MKFIELKKKKELESVYFLMAQLRPYLSFKDFLARFKLARKNTDYKLLGVVRKGEIIGLLGFMSFFVLYHSKCLYLCDFVIDEKLRAQGLGAKALKRFLKYAKKQGFEEIELSSSFFRQKTHEFYQKKMKFDKTGFVFKARI